MTEKKHQVLIVGGGAAGISLAAALKRKAGGGDMDIAIVEPSENHYYQPAFTLVGAGSYSLAQTQRKEKDLVPAGVEWIRGRASGFQPESNSLSLEGGESLTYDYLVVCPGLELNWEKIDGAKESLGQGGVCSNYSPEHVAYTWECLKKQKAGAKLLFTQAPLPFKCPGAPQKIAYLAADHLRKQGILNDCRLSFLSHAPTIFGVPFFARELNKVADRYGIQRFFQHNLVGIDGKNRTATFEILGGDREGETQALEYDLLHFTPPQSPPEVIRKGPLANEAGYVEVNQHSLQHVQYTNIFALGDAASTPNSKTAAAVRKQVPVVVNNILALQNGESLDESYDGYASCPLTTAYGKVIMAEFGYGGKVMPTFPLDPARERRSYWWIKATGLPLFYWNYMLKGYTWFLDHDRDFVES